MDHEYLESKDYPGLCGYLSTSDSGTKLVHYDWRRALDLALIYAEQTSRRYRVRGYRTQHYGWMWVVEPVPSDSVRRGAK